MKRLQLLSGIAIILFQILPLFGSVPGHKNGFRKLKWGDRPSREMTRANFGDKGHMQAYYILQEDPSVAGVKSAQIFYFYRKGRFCRVDVDWSGAESDAAVITAVLNREWGKPDEDTVHEGFISRKWVSRDGKTAAFLSRVDNLKTHDTGLPHLVIADLKCVAEAVNDPGL